jgi:hypothetical protein
MDKNLNPIDVKRLAWVELNLLNYSGSFPQAALEGAELHGSTPVHDLNGEVLFHRFPIFQNDVSIGSADVAAHTAFGAPLLAVAPLAVWDEQQLLAQAQDVLHKRGAEKRKAKPESYDEVRFVAYSYPKIAVQFLLDGKEVAMLECFSWIDVPREEDSKRKKMEPGSFERWSLLDELPAKHKRDNHAKFEERVNAIDHPKLSAESGGTTGGFGPISYAMINAVASIIQLTISYEIHFSGRSTDHHVCFELRGQETSVWCVVASVQMVLDFYRYNYPQTKIAQQLDLGTLSNPSGLPYGDENKVVTQLEVMSSNALSASMTATPTFAHYTSELQQNRPMISFIPGHSRAVAGYTSSLIALVGYAPFHGLLVYDPWPPNAGVITRWENYDTQTYRYSFSAHVTTI